MALIIIVKRGRDRVAQNGNVDDEVILVLGC